jgi:hypothetical protein
MRFTRLIKAVRHLSKVEGLIVGPAALDPESTCHSGELRISSARR